MMQGEAVAAEPTLIPPKGVTLRASSDVLSVPDPFVARAIRHIRNNPSGFLGVKDVVRQVGLSRRALEIRFRSSTGHTIHDEITRVHINEAKRLLESTDLPVAEVAHRSGYQSYHGFSIAFRRETGNTPKQYRARFQK
jgi:LacI family transcriptional regulator